MVNQSSFNSCCTVILNPDLVLTDSRPCPERSGPSFGSAGDLFGRRWYAIYTAPRCEKSALAHLALRDVESFLPAYEQVRLWKNRQRVKLSMPLFPGYLFARIEHRDRAAVLGSPGVLRIVGNSRGPIPVGDSTIDFLRSDLCRGRIEPYRDLAV